MLIVSGITEFEGFDDMPARLCYKLKDVKFIDTTKLRQQTANSVRDLRLKMNDFCHLDQ